MSITNHLTIKKYVLGLSVLFSLSGSIAMASGPNNDPIDRFRAGTLNIQLADDFSKDDALTVIQTCLNKADFTQTIKTFAKDSWNESTPSAFSMWLNKGRQWNAKTFTALCDAAFATTPARSLSYDALTYVHCFLKNNFETSPENKAIEFSFSLLDSVASSTDTQSIQALIPSLSEDQLIMFLQRAIQQYSPYFQPTYINSFKAQYPNFFGRTLTFFSQKKANHMLFSVWVDHYLEQDYGIIRQQKDWETAPYCLMSLLLKKGDGITLNFMAQPVTDPCETLGKHYAFLYSKKWSTTENLFDWGNLLVQKKVHIGLSGESITSEQKRGEAANTLFRLASKQGHHMALVLFCETLFYETKFNLDGCPIDVSRDPTAHYQLGISLLTALLKKNSLSSHKRAMAQDRLAKFHSKCLNANKTAEAYNEAMRTIRNLYLNALPDLTDLQQSLCGINLITMFAISKTISSAEIKKIPFSLLTELAKTTPFTQAGFNLAFGQLALNENCTRKQDGTVLTDDERSMYAYNRFKSVEIELNKLTNSIDIENTQLDRTIARNSQAQLLVKHAELFDQKYSTGQERFDFVMGLLEGRKSHHSDHVIKGLAYLNFLGDTEKAVEEFKAGSLKGEHGAHDYYATYSGIAESDEGDSPDEEDDSTEEESPPCATKQKKQQPPAAAHFFDPNEQKRAEDERDEKRVRDQARMAEKRRIQAEKRQKSVQMPFLPVVTEHSVRWEIILEQKAQDELDAITLEDKNNNKQGRTAMNRYLTLINDIQEAGMLNTSKTGAGCSLIEDNQQVLKKRFTHADRMVYTVKKLEGSNNIVLRIFGLRGHDATVEEMIRKGIAKKTK